MNLHIEGRTALLCGGSKGLLCACADRLAEAGCNIALVARNESNLRSSCDEIRERYQVHTTYICADLANEADRAEVVSRCPDPDILILGGGWPDISLEPAHWTASDWRAAIDAMMLAQISLISALSPGMAQRGFGRIIAITSKLIKEPELALAMPAAARLGLTGYIKALSREMAAQGVTVNTVLPGIFATETQIAHTSSLAASSGLSEEEIVRQRTRSTPANRFGTPQEFSALCAFLCSRDAAFMTGQALVMDGGAHPGIW